MENGIFVGLSRQMALERQMDLIANNIANITTPAFKGEQMVFVEYLAPTDDGQTLSYVQDLAQMRDTREGSFTPTGNTYDLAIKGDGYFVVRTDQPARRFVQVDRQFVVSLSRIPNARNDNDRCIGF